MGITTFKDKSTEQLFLTGRSRRLPSEILERGFHKLRLLDASVELGDLSAAPGNQLEPLSGDRVGQHSIRIDQRWRICFRSNPPNADDVEIVDYHK